MDQQEFLARIAEIDEELAAKALAIHARPFRALPALLGGYEGPVFPTDDRHAAMYSPFEGPNLLKTISDWYAKRYGARANVPSGLAKVPVVIRREIYLMRIPVGYGQSVSDATQLVDGLTDDMRHSLTARELQEIGGTFAEGFVLTYEIEDVRGSLARTVAGAGKFFEAALRDRDTAALCMTGAPPDLNGACFHAQQHAEKMLKGFLLARGAATEEKLRRMRHDMMKLYGLAVIQDGKLSDLANDVGLLANVGMDVRYMEAEVPIEAAVATTWAALRVGGAVACATFDRPRRLWSIGATIIIGSR